MTYKLYLDDLRPSPGSEWVVARSSNEAEVIIIKQGLPRFMSLDHDLGGDDTTMKFLKSMTELFPNGPVPEYYVHSANPVGKENIISYLESWKRSLSM